MEFSVLPKSKFLSLSPRNSHRSSQTTNQTVNVILPNTSQKQTEEFKPKYPPSEISTSEATNIEINPEQETHYNNVWCD